MKSLYLGNIISLAGYQIISVLQYSKTFSDVADAEIFSSLSE